MNEKDIGQFAAQVRCHVTENATITGELYLWFAVLKEI
jgi:hypothetical protein